MNKGPTTAAGPTVGASGMTSAVSLSTMQKGTHWIQTSMEAEIISPKLKLLWYVIYNNALLFTSLTAKSAHAPDYITYISQSAIIYLFKLI